MKIFWHLRAARFLSTGTSKQVMKSVLSALQLDPQACNMPASCCAGNSTPMYYTGSGTSQPIPISSIPECMETKILTV